VGVGVVEVRKDGFLVRHRDAETVDGNLAHAIQEIFESLGMQSEVDGVDVLAAEGRVHDCRRKRVGDRISGHTVDPCGDVDLLDAIDASQLLRGDLAGSGFVSGTGGGEGEDAAGANPQHAADDALFAHAQPNQ